MYPPAHAISLTMTELSNNMPSTDSTQLSLTMTSILQSTTNTKLEEEPACYARRLAGRLQASRLPKRVDLAPIPQTSRERLDASLAELPLRVGALSWSEIQNAEEKGKTFLYLAYGSNLCNETFRGVRGIKPLSQINVLVPSLRLTFDLPSIPYNEPCFANSAIRPTAPGSMPKPSSNAPPYHKDRWHKGMVGCVYEVTASDYAHIIATEGGGASYEDILVDCYPLARADTVPDHPSTMPFKAHTLFAPVNPSASSTSRFHRPDPSYAQPSARYLKLLTDGAAELDLPTEYQEYLNDIRPYTITTQRQKLGKMLFLGAWMPFVVFLMQLGKKFADPQGRVPGWLGLLLGWVFQAMWISYDVAFRRVFGDGERTEGLDDDVNKGEERVECPWSELWKEGSDGDHAAELTGLS
ncbi:unnamed protein product [Periconia digitata]|uniref:gamma-glutamylcyclotransferase n=1 Tax=Periconia digitata TaxID=1303443 RepID=A0A9W4UV40_9PLEO|nr:unnamed protein product [Periconia digitata]